MADFSGNGSAPRLWVTWEHQRRNRELSRALKAELVEFNCEYPALLRPLLMGKTLWAVIRRRPTVVFGQNPSLVLAALLVQLRRLRLVRLLIIDAHNAGLMPLEGRSPVLNRLARHIQRHADLVLVSNAGLVRRVEHNGGQAFVLPDCVPGLASGARRELPGRHNVLYVSTFAPDEPLSELLAAAASLGNEFTLFVSGDYRRARLDPSAVPPNVVLTGFLPEADYLSLLCSADVVVDLTTREDCLVCGAYEAVATGKPLVLSDTAANRGFFYCGAVFVRNSAAAISEGIRAAVAQRDRLAQEVAALRQSLQKDWTVRQERLEKLIAARLAAGTPAAAS
jgi:glycosyltransferase involved in cell wall biosynthesis